MMTIYLQDIPIIKVDGNIAYYPFCNDALSRPEKELYVSSTFHRFQYDNTLKTDVVVAILNNQQRFEFSIQRFCDLFYESQIKSRKKGYSDYDFETVLEKEFDVAYNGERR